MLAILVLATVLVTFFIAVLAGGALIGLASLSMQLLWTAGRTRDVNTAVALPGQVLQPACLPRP
jgi:hypothetical protein